jgi:hypothetical protein
MELPDCISYLSEEDIKPKTQTHLPEIINYLQTQDLEVTSIEAIRKMTKYYINYDNPFLYKLYLFFNPNLSIEEKEFYENKIKSLTELEQKLYSDNV